MINVELSKGINAKGIKTSILESCKGIHAGEELIIDYGDVRASGCLVQYAFCPKELLQSPSSSLDVLILRVPKFLAPPDNLRAKACENYNFPHTPDLVEKELVFEVGHDALSAYNSWPSSQGETDDLMTLRQYLTLCHLLDDDAVKFNIQTGRLRGDISSQQLAQALLLVVDSTLTEYTSLNETTNAQDLERANAGETTPIESHILRARICQRDTIGQWRHAFCTKYNVPSEFAQPTLHYQLYVQQMNFKNEFHPTLPRPKAPRCFVESKGCTVCGYTIRLKSCVKCKAVKYCGRNHQIVDWKRGHKQECNSLLGAT
jgi:hypothetical protein